MKLGLIADWRETRGAWKDAPLPLHLLGGEGRGEGAFRADLPSP